MCVCLSSIIFLLLGSDEDLRSTLHMCIRVCFMSKILHFVVQVYVIALPVITCYINISYLISPYNDITFFIC